MKLALQYTDTYNESIFSYVNNIPTPEGGMHETGFKTALTKVLNDLDKNIFIRKQLLFNFPFQIPDNFFGN